MKSKCERVLEQANNVLLGKEKEVKLVLSALLGGGHVLIEDVPGVGKTTLVYLMARLLGLEISRIQFTNDLLPGDILGGMIYRRDREEFEFKKGPIFGQVILADELNRATPKTQSALLQAMEERKVTIEGQDYPLDSPFLIIGTQNPFFQVGTFQLPESQLDRFSLSLQLNFPAREFEKRILLQKETRHMIQDLEPVFSADELGQVKNEIENIHTSEQLLDYLLDIIEYGRNDIEEGAYLSPRAGKDLLQASRSIAYIAGRDHVIPEDVQLVAPYILGHRVGGGKGVVYGHNLIKSLIARVKVND